MPDTPNGETVAPVEPKNNVNPPATPPEVKTPDNSEIERLRKEAEQAKMRANQLANELEAKKKAEDDAKAKELEEQNKYKDLYEQEKSRREQIEADKVESERKAEIKAKTDELYKGYPEAVRELANTTGLTLADTDDDTVADFKGKLDKIKSQLPNQKVTPNNPGNPTPKTETSAQDYHDIMRDPKKFEEYVKKNTKGMAAMTRQAE